MDHVLGTKTPPCFRKFRQLIVTDLLRRMYTDMIDAVPSLTLGFSFLPLTDVLRSAVHRVENRSNITQLTAGTLTAETTVSSLPREGGLRVPAKELTLNLHILKCQILPGEEEMLYGGEYASETDQLCPGGNRGR